MADLKSSQPPEERQTPYTAPDEGETLDGQDSRRLSDNRSSLSTSGFSKGQILAGRFRVLRFVARGGMGEVYEAEDLELNERVALKAVRFEMADNEHTTERFKREIQLGRKVTHPNVCRTFDVFRHVEQDAQGNNRDTLIVSMELLRGTTLSQRIGLETRLTTDQALPIVEQMAAGLQAAHDVGVIHRDFKSANVILIPAEGTPSGVRAVITDFGLAHAVTGNMASLTGSLDVVGTPAYMAPEQLEGKEITPATDTYALGIVMYEMLTGTVPFAGRTVISTAMRRLNEPAPSPKELIEDLEPRWEEAILRCLERAPERRFDSASDVAKALQGEYVKPAPPHEQPKRMKATLFAGIAAAALIVSAVSYFGLVQRPKQNKNTPAPAVVAETKPSLAILGFQNLSGRPDTNLLGDMLIDSLWSQLDADAIRFIPPSRVDEMRRDLDLKTTNENPSKEELSRIAKYLGCDTFLIGSYRAGGNKPSDKVDWNIHLVRASSGESTPFPQNGTQSTINTMATHAGKLIRAKLGVTLTLQEEQRLDSSMSANPLAMARFAEAREALRKFDFKNGIKLLQSSVDADPKFVKARVALAGAWSDLGFESKAQAEAKKALDLSESMSAEGKGLVAGRYYEAMHDWPKAMEQYSSLWTLDTDSPEYGLLLARSQTSGGKGDSALTTLRQVRKLKLPSQLEVQANLLEAEAQEALSNFDKQLVAATEAAKLAQTLGAHLLLARARIQQCGALLNAGKAEEAKPVCSEARKLNEDSGDTLGTARATNELAKAYWRSGDLAQANPLYEEALGLAQTIGDKLDEAGALNNLANIRGTLGDKAGAARGYQQSLAVAKERGSLSDEALAQQNLGMTLYWLGNNKAGEAAFQQALRIARQIGDRDTEARALANRCSALLNASQIVEARRSCEQSLQLRRAMDDQSALAGSLGAIGDVELTEGDVAAAEQHYSEALRIQESLGQKADAATSRIWLASLALANGRFADGGKFAGDAAQEFALEKDARSEIAARTVLADALLASGNIQGAETQVQIARKLAAGASDQSLGWQVDLRQAKIDSTTNGVEAAIQKLKKLEGDARKGGVLSDALDARVALGEAQLRAGHAVEGRKTLASAALEAKSKGLGLIEKKALAASKPS
jgi:tetratricopeptide (TPR) repeat protein/TolB-like protein/tRNA A-37 threonylcarbamoyl transferase component Bud32